MIRIITDSTADVTPQRSREAGIQVVPLTVNFGEESFLEGVDLSTDEFYARLEAAQELPTTAQVPPVVFEKLFREYREAGDEIICITISSAMSGTCQSALVARELVGPEGIYVIDSQTVTFALRLLVEEAARLRDEGLPAAEIASEVAALVPRVRLLAMVGTLKYLKMGGRLSASSAVIGSILGICPVITIKDGLVEAIGKPRGQKAAFDYIRKQMEKLPPEPGRLVTFGHTNSPQALAQCRDYFLPLMEGHPVLDGPIGSVVGTHVGPGAVGFAYLVAEEK